MYSFNSYKQLLESGPIKSGSKTNAAGVMHELLVGKYLNGGKHMVNHHGVTDKGNRVSPREAHDQLKHHFTHAEYRALHARAAHAAEAIHGHIMAHHIDGGGKVRGKIHAVHWTSKDGDTKKITGLHASQKEDPSDIYVTVKHHDEDGDAHITHHGVSLKASDTVQKHIPIANPGMETTEGGEHHIKAHHDEIKKTFPKLRHASNSKARKELMKADPEMSHKVREKNRIALTKLASHTAKVLQKKSPKQLAHHLEKHVLLSGQTPAEKNGHYHWRASTDKTKDGYRTRIMNPHEHYAPVIAAAHKGELEVRHNGSSSVDFHHKGKVVASHGFKFKSQSDPIGSPGGRTTSRFHGKTYRGSPGH